MSSQLNLPAHRTARELVLIATTTAHIIPAYNHQSENLCMSLYTYITHAHKQITIKSNFQTKGAAELTSFVAPDGIYKIKARSVKW